MGDALVGGGLVLPRTDDHHRGLAGLEGLASGGLVHAGDGVATLVEVTHLLQEGLVLRGVDGDLAVHGVHAAAVALEEGAPAQIGQGDAVLRTVGLGQLLGDLKQLVPGGRDIGFGQAGLGPHVGVVPHGGRRVAHRNSALLLGAVDVEGDLIDDVRDVVLGLVLRIVIEVGDALEGAVQRPALAVVGAGGHEVRAIARGDLGDHGLADGRPRLQLGIDEVLVLRVVEVVDDAFEGLAVGLGEAVPHRDLDLAVFGLLDTAVGAATGQTERGDHRQRHAGDEAFLHVHGFLLISWIDTRTVSTLLEAARPYHHPTGLRSTERTVLRLTTPLSAAVASTLFATL